MALFRKGISYLQNKRQVPSLDGTIESLSKWFDTPLGKQLLAEEKKILDKELSCMFGYHLLQLSINRNLKLYQDSRINHCFSMGVGQQHTSANVSAYSQLDALPFDDEEIDVTILHHVLEFSSNPHQVLKEASRVTIPRGYIVVVGFNPNSIMGAIKPFTQLFSSNPIWKRQSLRKSRVSDWLQFLDCNTLRTQSGLYNLPWQNRQYLDSSASINQLLQRWGVPFGNFYCLIARKDRVSLTPLRPDWSRHTGFRGAKQAMSARSAARLALIKRVKR